MKTDLLQALLFDIREHGCVWIAKRKLLWMLGRTNESKTAWASLLEEWNEIGGEKGALHGFEHVSNIILTARPTINIGDEWAK